MIDVSLTVRLDVTRLPYPRLFAETILADLRRITEGSVVAVNVEGWYPLETVIKPTRSEELHGTDQSLQLSPGQE